MDGVDFRRLPPQYGIEDLHTYLRRFQLSRGLAHRGYLSADLWRQQPPFRYVENQAFSEWQVGFVAQELIRVGSNLAPLLLED